MKKVLISYILCLLLGSITGCTDNNQCEAGNQAVKSLQDFGCSNVAYNVDVFSANEYALIRSEEEYNQNVEASCQPNVDWNNYDLIIGKQQLSNGLERIERNLVVNCSTNQLTLQFTFYLSITQIAPEITFDAMIPKMMDNQDLYVELIQIN